jgi:hypothetical protein
MSATAKQCTCGSLRSRTDGVFSSVGLDGLAHKVSCNAISGNDILPCDECGQPKPRSQYHTAHDCVWYLKSQRRANRRSKPTDPWANMHRECWIGLRHVRDHEPPGSPLVRDLLMARGLIEWVPGGTRCRLTESGRKAMNERDRH